jgi:glycosyltransferase involved in cell wall biosynthesis
MHVYAPVTAGLSPAMNRVDAALRKYAPEGVTFVDQPEQAEVQVLHVIGHGSMPHLRCKRFAMIQYCYLTTENASPSAWLPWFKKADLVMSYYDLFDLTQSEKFNFLHAPLGVDGEMFKPTGTDRRAAILTSGTEPAGEAIIECWEAAKRVGQPAVHLGPSIPWGPGIDVKTGVADSELADLYSRCWYVSGLRRGEGFELPVVEGLACGCRPICFDRPEARFWFRKNALYVTEGSREEIIDQVAAILAERPKPVTDDERQKVVKKFDWQKIMGIFWKRLLEAA